MPRYEAIAWSVALSAGAIRFSLALIASLSCQSFGPQPFQIFAQGNLLLLVFSQRAVRWTEYVVGVIFGFAHDVTFRTADGKRPRPWGRQEVNRHRPATARRMGQSRADQPQVK